MKLEFFNPKFTPPEGEIEKLRREAVEAGMDPDAAEEAFRNKLDQANSGLREDASEDVYHLNAEDPEIKPEVEALKARIQAAIDERNQDKAA